MTELVFEPGGRRATWWGRDDYVCPIPGDSRQILLPYHGEPGHGDSYHRLIIDGRTIKGAVWSGYFLWSACGRYFTCDWLEGMGGQRDGAAWVFTQVLRATIVVEPRALRYRIVLTPSRDALHQWLADEGEDALWQVLLDARDDDWVAFE